MHHLLSNSPPLFDALGKTKMYVCKLGLVPIEPDQHHRVGNSITISRLYQQIEQRNACFAEGNRSVSFPSANNRLLSASKRSFA